MNKRESRKQRNRESAARSRQRQREHVESLEARVAQLTYRHERAMERLRALEAENADLRARAGLSREEPASMAAAGDALSTAPRVATPVVGSPSAAALSVPGPSAAATAAASSALPAASSAGDTITQAAPSSDRSTEAMLLASLIDFFAEDSSAAAPAAPAPTSPCAPIDPKAASVEDPSNDSHLYLRKPAELATITIPTITTTIIAYSISLLERGETMHRLRTSRISPSRFWRTPALACETLSTGGRLQARVKRALAAMPPADCETALGHMATVRRLAESKGALRTASVLSAAAAAVRRRAQAPASGCSLAQDWDCARSLVS